jgi:hypothetical protein
LEAPKGIPLSLKYAYDAVAEALFRAADTELKNSASFGREDSASVSSRGE